MNQAQIEKIRKIASMNNSSARIVNNHDGITIILRSQRGSRMSEVEAKRLQEDLKEGGFDSCRKHTQDGWTVII